MVHHILNFLKTYQIQKRVLILNMKVETVLTIRCSAGTMRYIIKKDPQQLYHYKNINDNINWENTEDMKLSDIDKFERKNNISITVVGVNKNKCYVPLRIPKIQDETKHINLLLVNDGDNWHYVYIKNISRLLSSQYNNHHGKKNIFVLNAFMGFHQKNY